MLKAQLPEYARQTLRHILHRHGEVLYSSHETIRPGDVYLMGLNPGGVGFITIEKHIEQMLTRTKNAYLDEEFANGTEGKPPKKSLLQKRVHWLLGQLGLKTEDVCASNLIFQTSRNSDGVCFGLAGVCWPFHEAIIEIVRPKLLLTFGNGEVASPYAFVKELFCNTEPYESEFGSGKTKCRGFSAEINGHQLYVAGLPHLSYHNPEGKQDVVDWLKSKL